MQLPNENFKLFHEFLHICCTQYRIWFVKKHFIIYCYLCVYFFFFINFFFIIKYFFQNFKNDFCLLWAVKWLSSSSGNLWNNSNLTILQILLCLKLVTWWYEGMPTIYNKTCFLEYACINVYNCIFQFKLMLELEDLYNISGCELTYMYI